MIGGMSYCGQIFRSGCLRCRARNRAISATREEGLGNGEAAVDWADLHRAETNGYQRRCKLHLKHGMGGRFADVPGGLE